MMSENCSVLEFFSAQQATRASLEAMQLPEIPIFIEEFLSPFGKNLDELLRE